MNKDSVITMEEVNKKTLDPTRGWNSFYQEFSHYLNTSGCNEQLLIYFDGT